MRDLTEEMEVEAAGKQCRWCHLVMSNPLASLVTNPSLSVSLLMVLEHFSQAERFDLAYSATIFVDDIGESFEHKQRKWIGNRRGFENGTHTRGLMVLKKNGIERERDGVSLGFVG